MAYSGNRIPLELLLFKAESNLIDQSALRVQGKELEILPFAPR